MSAVANSRLRCAFLVAAAALLAPSEADGATLTWSADGVSLGGTGTWDTTSAFWSDGLGGSFTWSNATPDSAIFTATAGTVTLGEPISADSLTFYGWGYTLTGSTLTLLSGIDASAGSATINSAIVLSGNNAWTAGAGKTLAIGGTVDNAGFGLTFAGAGDASVSGVISGAGGLTKTGNGTLTLSGANTYSGGTTVSAGMLIGNTTSLQGAITNDAAVTFDQATAGTYAGVMSGTGWVEKRGAGTLTLSGQNTLAGQLNILAGTVVLGHATNTLSDTVTVVVEGGTTLDIGSNSDTIGNLWMRGASSITGTTGVLSATSVTFSDSSVTSGQNGTISANLGGSAALTVSNSYGTLTLTGTNSYSGGTSVLRGTLQVDSVASLPGYAEAGKVFVDNGGTLSVAVGGANNWSAAQIDTLRANATWSSATGSVLGFNTAAGDFTYGSTITTGGVAKFGSNTLTLTGSNTYTGLTAVYEGTLALGHATNTLSDASSVLVAGGTLDIGANTETVGQVTIRLGSITGTTGVLTASSIIADGGGGSATISAILAGAGSLTRNGGYNSTLTLTGANTYTGGTNVLSGTLNFAAGSLGSTGTITLKEGTLQWAPGNTEDISARLVLVDGRYGVVDTNGNNVVFASAFGTGNAGFVKRGSGTLTLLGANTYAGRTDIQAGTLALGHATNTLSDTGEVWISNGGILDIGANSDTVGAVLLFSGSIAGTTGTLTGASYELRSGAVSAQLGGAGALTKFSDGTLGGGTVTLSGANTYSGGTTVSAGTLIGNTTSLQGAITNDAAVTFNQTSAGTYAGEMSGAGSLTKTGNGALTLSGNNSFTGATTVSAGTLILGHANALGGVNGSVVTVSTGGTLDLGSASPSIKGLVLSGTGAVTLPSAGTVTVGASGIDMSGATQDLSLTGFGLTVGANQSWNVASGRTLTVGGGGSTVALNSALTLSGSGVTWIGSSTGATTLTGSGNLNINAGRLAWGTQTSSSIAGYTGSFVLNSGGILSINTSNALPNLTINGGTLGSFSGTARTLSNAVTVGGDFTIGGSETASTVGNVSTGAITISGAIDLGGGTRTVTVAGSGGATFSGTVSNGGLIKAGANTLTLSGDNSAFAGAITLAGGTLSATTAASLGTGAITAQFSGANLALTAASTLDFTLANNINLGSAGSALNFNLTKNAASASTGTQLNLTGVISGGNASTTLFLNTNTSGDNTSVFRFAGNNTFQVSQINLNRGAISVASATGLGDTRNVVYINTNQNLTSGSLRFESAMTLANPISLNSADVGISTAANNVVLSGVLSGSVGINKLGTGVLTLSAANTYSGTTTVTAGTLRHGIADALAAGAVTVAGGTLDIGAYSDSVGAVTLSAGSIIGSGGTLTGTSYVVTNATGATTISANLGTGTLTMSGSGGTLNFSGNFAGAMTLSAGGTLNFSGALTGGGAIAVNGASTFNFLGTTSGYTGSVSNGSAIGGTFTVGASANLTTTGTFAVSWARTLLVDGTLSTGAMTISSGGNATSLNGAGTVTVSSYASHNAGTNLNFGMTGSFTDTGAFTLGASTSSSTDIRFNQNSGTVNLSAAGATDIQLAGTYKGSYYLNAGTLNATNAATNLSSAAGITGSLVISGGTANLYGINATLNATATGVLTVTGGTLKLGAGGITNSSGGTATISLGTATVGSLAAWSSVANIALTGTTTFDTTGGDITELGALTGTGGFTKAGTGTLTLLGGNSYTGAVTLSAGTLALGGSSTGVSTLTPAGGTLLILSAGGAGSSTLALGSSSTVRFSSLGGAYYYLGGLSAASAGTGYNIALQDNGGTPAAITLAVGQGNASSTYAGVLSGAGSLVKSGTGTLTLTGTNTYTGTTTVSGGTLAVSTVGALPGYNSAGKVTVGNGGTLVVSTGASWTSAEIDTLRTNATWSSATGSILGFDTTAGDFTYGSVISTGGLIKLGANTLTLTGANTFTGNVLVSAGTLKLNNKNALGALSAAVTKVTVASGATVDFNGIIDATNGYTIAGTGVGGAGALVNTGAAIGNNSAQATNLKLSANASIGGSANWAILTSSYAATTLDLGGFTLTKVGANTISLVNISTANTLVAGSAGTIQISGGVLSTHNDYAANLWNLALTLDNTAGAGLTTTKSTTGATLTLGSLAGGGATGGNITNAGTIVTGGLGTSTTYAGVISGAGALTKQGLGTMTLTGVNTYTGTTTLAAGTLQLDFSAASSAPSTLIKSGNALSFTGTGTLEVKGRSATTSVQTLGAITLSGGNANFLTTLNSATSLTLSLGNITRSAGATATFTTPAAGAVIGTSQTNTDNILGAWAFIGSGNAYDYAVAGASSTANITAYSGYTALTLAGASSSTTTYSYSLAAGANTMTGATTAKAIKFTTNSSASTLALGANAMTTGGLLLQGASTGAVTVTGTGILGNGTGEFILNNSSAASLTIQSGFIGSGAGSFTKTGAGTVILQNATAAGTWNNSFTGNINVNQGELQVREYYGSAIMSAGTYTSALGGSVTVNPGATLRFWSGASSSNTYTYANNLTLRDANLINQDGKLVLSGTVALSGNNSVNIWYNTKDITLSNVVSGSGSLTLSSNSGTAVTWTSGTSTVGGTPATLQLTNAANTYTGTITLNSGTSLNAQGAASALGATSLLVINSGASLLWDRSSGASQNLFTNTTTSVVDLKGVIWAYQTQSSGYATTNLNIPKLLLDGGTYIAGGSTGAINNTQTGTLTAVTGTTTNLVHHKNGGYSQAMTFSGALSGSGNIVMTRETGASNDHLMGLAGNTSGYTGSITVSAVASAPANSAYFFSGTNLWGAGTLTATGAGATVVLGDPLTNYNGAWTSPGSRTGTLTTTGSLVVGAGGLVQLLNKAGTDFTSAEIGSVTLNGGTLGLYGSYATPGSFIPQANAVWSVGGTALSTISAPLSVNYSGATFNVGDSVAGSGTDLLVSGVIGGSKMLTKVGAGTMTLTAANTTTGGFYVTAGTLNVGNAGATGTLGSGTIVIGAAGRVALNHSVDSTTANNFAGTGTLAKLQGAAVETLTGNLSGFAGTIAIAAGTSSVTNVLALGTGADASASTTTVAQYAALRSLGDTRIGSVTLVDGGNLQLQAGTPTTATAFFNVNGAMAFVTGSGIVVSNTTAIDPGTYRVLNYTSGSLTYNGLADITGLTARGLAPSRNQFTLVNDTTAKTLDMVVTGVAASLVWNGSATTWDSAQLTAGAWNNTSNGGVADVFYNFDQVSLNDSLVAAAQTITLDGTITPGSITVSGTQDYTLTGTGSLAGVANIVKSGSGTLRLENTTANTLTGTITVNGGKLAVTAPYAMSTGGLILNTGATFANATAATPKTVGRNLTASGSVTFGDAIDTGALTFSGTNNLTALTTVTANVATTFSGTTTIGTALSLTGASAVTLPALALSGNTALTTTNTGGVTINGIVSGAFSLTKEGSGTLVLTGANTFTGGAVINAGVLQMGSGGTAGTLSSGTVTVASGAELKLYRSDTSAITVANNLSGAGTVRLLGTGASNAGSYSLTGTNTGLTGQWIIDAGARLNAGAASNLGSAPITVLATGGLYVAGTYTLTNNLTLAGRGWLESTAELGAIRLSGGTVSGNITLAGDASIGAYISSGTITGNITETGGARKLTLGHAYTGSPGTGLGNSGGTLTLSGNNTYSGGTDLVGLVTVTATTSTALGTGTVTIGNNSSRAALLVLGDGTTFANAFAISANGGSATSGVIQLSGISSATISGAITVAAAPTAGTTFSVGTGTLSLTGGISGAAGVSFGAGNYIVANGINLAGNVTVGNGTTSIAGGVVTTGTGTQTYGAGNYTITGGINSAGAVAFGNGTSSVAGGITTGAANVTLGTGTYTLAGGGTYPALSLASGTVRLGGADGLGTTGAGAATFNLGTSGAATLDLNGFSQSPAVLLATTSGLTVTNSSGTSAAIKVANTGASAFNFTGNLALELTGSGTKNLTGANTYTGGTTVSAGSLELTALSAIGTGGLTVASGASFALTQGTSATLGGALAGAGTVNKAGAGTLTLGTVSGFSGALNINAGGLVITGTTLGGGAGASGAITVADGASLSAGVTTGRDIQIQGGDGLGTFGGVLRAGSGPAAGTLATTGTLEFGYRAFDFGPTRLNVLIGDGTADLIDLSGGTLKLYADVSVSFLNGGFGTGTYTVLKYDVNNAANELTGNLVKTGSYGHTLISDFTHDTLAGTYAVTVTKANMIWTGATSADVDGVTANFNLSTTGAADTLLAGDELVFNDTATTRTVNLAAGIPELGKVTVDTALGYTLAGTGGFAGANTQLIKTGSGTLSLGGVNTFGGGVRVNAGTLAVSADNALGDAAGSLALAAGTTLQATGSFTLAATRAVTLGGGANVSVDSGATLTYAGSIGGAGSLTKVGNGILALGGTSTYSGGTTLAAGTLQFTGNNALLSTGALTLNGGTLALGATTQTVGTLTVSTGTLSGTGSIATSNLVVTGTLSGAGTVNVASYSLSDNAVINSGLTLGGTATLAKSTAGTLTIAANLANSGGVSVSAGTLAFSGTNNGTGTVTVSGGTLAFSGTNAGTSNFSVSGGTLAFTGTNTGSGTLSVSGGTLNFSGANGGTGALSVSGGTALLTGTNTYSGGTTLSGTGTIQIGSAGALGAAAATLTITGGTLSSDSSTARVLTAAGTLSLGGSFTLGHATNNGALTLNNAINLLGGTRTVTLASDVTLGGAISNGSFTKAGAGTLTLTGVSTMTGTFGITAGLVRQGVASAMATAANISIASGASYDVNGLAGLSGRTVTIAGTGLAGATGAAAAALYNGSNTSAALGNITLSGDATIGVAGGGSTSVSPDRSTLGAVNLGGYTLNLIGGGVNSPGFYTIGSTLSNGNIIATNVAISAGGAQLLTNGTAATLTLKSNAYLSARDLNSTNTSNLVSVVLDGGTISSAGVTANGQLLDNAGYSGNNGGGSGFQNFQNPITVAAGGGTLQSRNSTFNIDMSFAGSFSGSGALSVIGTRGIILKGDTSGYTGTLTLSNTSNTLNFNPNAAVQTFNGVISGAAALTKSGANTTVLAGANTSFTGTSTVSAGTLRLANANALSGSALTLNGGSVAFDASVTGTFNVGSVAAAGANNIALQNNAATPAAITLSVGANNTSTTIGSVVSGAGALVKVGTGALTLSGANTYAGGTTLSAGTIKVGGNSALGSGTLTLNGGTLSSDSTTARSLSNNLAFGGDVTLGDATNSGALTFSGAIDLGAASRTLAVASTVIFSGAVSNGSLVKAGATTTELALTGTNTFSGSISIQSGKVALNSLGANAGLASVSVAANGTLSIGDAFNGATATIRNLSGSGRVDPMYGAAGTRTLAVDQTADTTFSGVIVDSNSGAARYLNLTKTGNAKLTLSGASTYTGATTVSAGTLEVSGTLGASGVYAGAITNNAALAFASASNQTLSGVVGGTGSLTKSGTGTLTLSGANTYTGNTVVNGGRVLLATADALSADSAVTLGSAGTLAYGYAITGDTAITRSFGGSTGTVELATSGSYIVSLSGLSGFTGEVKLSTGLFDNIASGWSGNLTLAGGAITGSLKDYVGQVTVSTGATVMAATSLPANVILASGGTIDFAGFTGNATIGYAGGTLANASGFTGNVVVRGAVSLGAGSIGGGSLVVGSGASVNVTGALTNAVTLSGGAISGGANLVGNITIASGNFTIGATGGAPGIDALNANAALAVTGGTLDLNSLSLAATNVINFSSGSLAGAANFAGTLNVVSGGTLSNVAGSSIGGTMNVRGLFRNNGTVTGDIIVESGGTLAGGGTFATATIQDGGTLSPGNSPGVQTYTGNLTINGGAHWLQQIYSDEAILTSGPYAGSRGYDTIVLLPDAGFTPATLDLTGASSVNRITLFLMTLTKWTDNVGGMPAAGNMTFVRDGAGEWIPKEFVIATYTGNALLAEGETLASIFDFDSSGFYFTGGLAKTRDSFHVFEVTTESGMVQLTLSVVPEPSTYGLVLGGLALAAAAIRRRSRRANQA